MTPVMTNDKKPVFCIAGDRIVEATDDFIAGQGTYIMDEYIYASLTGEIKTVRDDKFTTVKVQTYVKGVHLLPEVGSIVTCCVLSVNQQQASLSILAVDDSILHQNFQGIIKKLNVRQHQIDMVEVYKSFKPKDIVIAKVLSLGGARSYELSTASNELGVVQAKCEKGHCLVPISWTAMKCPCGIENRKVAKIVPTKGSEDI